MEFEFHAATDDWSPMDSTSRAVIDFALEAGTRPESSAEPPRYSLRLTHENEQGQQVISEFLLSAQLLADMIDAGRLELAHLLILSMPSSTRTPSGSAGH